MNIKGNVEGRDSMNGSLSGVDRIHGSISRLDVIHGKSAYEIAVIHGFSGTEEEWLASLEGSDGVGISSIKQTTRTTLDDGDNVITVTLTNGTKDTFKVQNGSKGADGKSAYEYAKEGGYTGTEEQFKAMLAKNTPTTARIADITLPADKWVGTESPYSQVVTVEGVTEFSQVDLTPSVEQLSIFYNKDLAFVTENEDGVVTVYAIGQKPMNDYVIQATITEVNV